MGRQAVTSADFDDATYSLGGPSLDADILRPPSVVVDGPAQFKLLSQKSRTVRQLQKAMEDLADQHSQESSRADSAQRQTTMIAASLRDVQRELERERSDHSVTREELGMYKVQLNAQQEVTRKAQLNIDDLTRRLERAEQDAADARTVAHQLREELQVIRAREQGRNEGFRAAIRVRKRLDSEGASRGRRRAMSVDNSVDEVLIERRSPVTVLSERSATPARLSSSRTTSVRAPMPTPVPEPIPRAPSRPPPPPIENLTFGFPFTEDEDSIPSGSSPLSSSYTTSESIDVRQRQQERQRGTSSIVPPQVAIPAHATPSREQRDVMPTPALQPQLQPQPHDAPRQRRLSRLSLRRQSRSGSRGPAEAQQDPQSKTTTRTRGRALINVPNIYAPSTNGQGSDASNDLIPRAREEAPGTGRLSIYLPPPHEMARAETPHRPDNFHVVQSPESGVSGLSVPVIPAEAPPRPPTAPPKQRPPRLSMSRPNSAPPVPRSPEGYNPPPPIIYAAPTPIHPAPRKPIPTLVPGPHVKSGLLGPYSHHAPTASAISSDYDLLHAPTANLSRPPTTQPILSVRNPDQQARPGSRSLKRSFFRKPQPMGMVMEEAQHGSRPKRGHSPTSTPPSSSPSPPLAPPTSRPDYSRAQSSGMIRIDVESPSPETSPQYEPLTPISHPDLLSPDFAARPLPPAPPEPREPPPHNDATPRAHQAPRQPMSDTTYPAYDTFSADRVYRPRHSRQQTYEYAPIPDQVRYPDSPIAVMSPETVESQETPKDGQAVLPPSRPFSVKPETIGESSTSEGMSSTSLGFLGLRGFPGRTARLFRRHT